MGFVVPWSSSTSHRNRAEPPTPGACLLFRSRCWNIWCSPAVVAVAALPRYISVFVYGIPRGGSSLQAVPVNWGVSTEHV